MFILGGMEDEKEMAEHVPIVDLIRNDLSIHSSKVQVDKFRYIDKLKTHDKNLLQVSSVISGKLPEGYEAHILPRSSTFKNWGLLHASSGIIDEAYCGDDDEWFFCAHATRDGVVENGSRVCQFRLFKKMSRIVYQMAKTLDNPNRGGFGSTGK